MTAAAPPRSATTPRRAAPPARRPRRPGLAVRPVCARALTRQPAAPCPVPCPALVRSDKRPPMAPARTESAADDTAAFTRPKKLPPKAPAGAAGPPAGTESLRPAFFLTRISPPDASATARATPARSAPA